jgi:hypothetical protein
VPLTAQQLTDKGHAHAKTGRYLYLSGAWHSTRLHDTLA